MKTASSVGVFTILFIIKNKNTFGKHFSSLIDTTLGIV